MIIEFFIQTKRPRGAHPGAILPGRAKIVGDTITLIDSSSGKSMMDGDERYSRKLRPGDNPKEIGQQLLRAHYNAGHGSPRGFNDPIRYGRNYY